jgi:o-succinylbenzoate---CoA ligase
LSTIDALSLWQRAASTPEATAVIDGLTGEAWSFAELARRVGGLLPRLRARLGDPRAPSCTVLAATTNLSTFLTLHALVAAGLPFLPIHPRLTASERAALAQGAGEPPDRILDDEALAELVEGRVETQRSLELPDPIMEREPTDLEPLALLATSGTSGAPKLARLTRGAFLASARATLDVLRVTAADTWLLALPLCHVGGLSVLTRSLLAGNAVVLLPRFSPASVAAVLARSDHRPTLFPVVPTMLRDWLVSPTPPTPEMGLRALIVGGAGCPDKLLDECAARGVLALTTYGLTESCSQLALQPLRGATTRQGGSGKALPGSSLTIVDSTGAPLPAGVVGEIVAGGPTLFAGYEGQPSRGDRPFFTGDFGHLDEDGNLFVEGRRTDRIVSGGENVAPLEVEAAARAFAGVEDVVVFGVPDDRWGEAVAIAVVLAAGSAWQPRELDAHLRARLAPFKCPRRFAVVGSLPLNAMGKLDRKRARDMYTNQVAPLSNFG